MNYLLIDFGASFIKVAEYNKTQKKVINSYSLESPFKERSTIYKEEIKKILEDIVKKHKNIDGIVACSILGGFYEKDCYYSWKSNKKGTASCCMLSGLFFDTKNFHLHEHHARHLNINNYSSGLNVVGQIEKVNIYSILGDTDCVIKSVLLDEDTVLINMGTGSQFVTKSGRISYIPSGRAFLTFYNLFAEVGFNIFDLFKEISILDIQKSSLSIDLNVFEKSLNYNNGGSIFGIKEENFNIKNLLSSLIKSFVDQYDQFIKDEHKKIILTGGIPKKIPSIREYLSLKYPNKTIIVDDDKIENTHRGIIKYIEEYL